MKYSVIIPTHNAQNTIKDAINSVLIQSNKDYEIIIVDDYSTDNTRQVLNSIKNEKIKIIYLNESRKAGGARNAGISVAQGKYIIFLDDDDVLEEKAIEKIDNIIGKENTDIIYLGFIIQRKESKEILIPNEHNSIKKYRLSEWKYENVWDICWNKEFLNKNNIRFIENKYFEDFLFYYQGILLSQTYKYVEDITHIYTGDRKGSASTEVSLKKLEDLYSNMSLLLKFINTLSDEYYSYILDGISRNNNYINKLIDKYKEEI